MPSVYFRCDGNKEIATGHIMRCLSIARACASLNAEICFLVSNEESISILKERFAFPNEFSIHCLNSDYHNMEAEIPIIKSIIAETTQRASLWLLIDSYYVTESYLSSLQKFCRIAYLDDILAFDYPVDLIINYDMDIEPACYHKAAIKLIGHAYTPLREQFKNVSYKVHPEVQNILISTGGTDAYNVAVSFIKNVFTSTTEQSTEDKCHYHIITSRLNTRFQEIEQLASMYPMIHIHENVHNMAELMCRCDLALSAGGTTLCELCAVGVPTISFATADNQLNAIKAFYEKGIIRYAGDVRFSLENILDNLMLFIKENSASYARREQISKSMRAYIDGNGADRIAAKLVSP